MKMERRKRLLLLFICTATLGICRASDADSSCVAAGFSDCCIQHCELQSGCYCDLACYETGLCCTDIASVCSLPELCSSDPCQNSGVCVPISLSDYTCQCMYGYAGELCEIDINFCDSDPCLNGGNCTDGIFTFTCDCPIGFSGRQCQMNIDECESNPCGQFGTCIDGEGQYTCVCTSGYTGVDCEMNIDDCDPNPCVNGDCIDGVDSYTCNCDPSFAGVNCSIMTVCSIEEDTCQNNGLCNVTFEGGETRETVCVCLHGYEGENCETDTDECAGSPCLNGGTCLNLVGEYSCNCPIDFTGQNCSIEIDPCDPTVVPCKNGALCREGDCFCRNGFTGVLCEINIDDCLQADCHNGASCIDEVASFTCQCPEDFSGRLCNISTSDPCSVSPCLNGATCEVTSSTDFLCTCSSGFTGVNCSERVDFCVNAQCAANNTATCMNTGDGFVCICLPGYTGITCRDEIDECALLDPCENDGECIDMINDYACVCADGYEGLNCREEINECLSNPCQNDGTCVDEVAQYECICSLGYVGDECQENVDDCASSPCQNNATCEDLVADYLCVCRLGYTGQNCSVEIMDCSGEPCGNGGTCEEVGASYRCECAPGFTGENCMFGIGDCALQVNPCHGAATCVDGIESFSCICPPGFTGPTCDTMIDYCTPNPCLNEGNCTSQINGSLCSCLEGFTGTFCETRQCSLDCANGSRCIDDGGSFSCDCAPGFTGPLCEMPFPVCDTMPCAVNSTCLPLPDNTFMCLCSEGYTGQTCEEEIDECDSMPCDNDGVCMDLVNGFECMCRNGFTGDTCQTNIDNCSPNPCRHNSTCTDLIANYSCECTYGFEGRNCTVDIDLCDPLPCMNGGSCTQNLTQETVVCTCLQGFHGQYCQFDVDECNVTTSPCMNGGVCRNTRGGFFCDCPSGFSGQTCEEDVNDNCNIAGIEICMNNATCVDTGNTFQCVCPPGYTGSICDLETRECDSDPCQNNGLCHDEFLNFTCTCTADYTGRLCDINLNPCSSNPCMNAAICSNGEPGSELFSCACAPGFTGTVCDEDIDDCESDPCLMGSTCIDGINNFTCNCASGFDGRLCDNDIIDHCNFPYCLNGGTCIDVGDHYVCMCDTGFTGLDCEFGINECQDNPCFNNATCRDLFGGYDCMCLPGFTGADCGVEIDECTGVDCNNGTCRDLVNDYICDCTPGYMGDKCDMDVNECAGVECLFGGTCIDQVNNYTCECVQGFKGRRCEENIDDCVQVECGNGTCLDLVDDYTCQCVVGYTGSMCEVMVDECDQLPCVNNATCVDELNNFTCLCSAGFKGRYCEINIDECISNTCLNGATCVDGINSYTCECEFGYEGENCEMLVDFCTPTTCGNNGTCTTTIPGITACLCTPFYTGSNCEEYINLCQEQDQCFNGGECISTEENGAPAFECKCTGPYRGHSCEIFDPCVEFPCSNNGTCTADPNITLGYQCHCVSPYLGHNCLYSDLCLVNQPCFNGGTCTNNIPSLIEILDSDDGSLPAQTISCVCGPAFTGAKCEVELTPCYHLPCANGGTCLLDSTNDRGYSCQCTLTWHGINCTEEINIVTPSFNGSSYLSHSLPPPASAEFNYSLALLTADTSGLLLYVTQSNSQNYIALGLESGQVVLYLRTESGSIELRTQTHINDNTWHAIELHVDTQEASLQVDSEIERSDPSGHTQLDSNAIVYVGGLPDLTVLPSDVMQTTGLVGCVHDRMANGQSVELTVIDHEGRDIAQCLESVCPYIQCQNGADCNDIAEFPGFVCECLPFFSGVYCETSLPLCEPNPCLFGGLCREEQATFVCLCPLGRAGRTCDDGLSIVVPSFSGNSYITYPPNTFLSAAVRMLTISITFSPTASSGILFFTSTSEVEFSDYFSLALVDGHVEFRYNLGSGQIVVKSEMEVELNIWHTITATLSFGRGQLSVDNEPVIVGSSQSIFTVLNTQSNIWLGGYENFVNLSSISGTAEGFSGCISSLVIDGSTLDLILDADSGYDVTQCNTSSCANNPCMNGGSCFEEGPSFVCVCPPGVSGILCSNVAGRCQSETDLCAGGATCVSSEDGLSFTCLCPVGRDGERCDEDIEILTPEFNTTSYLQYNPYIYNMPLSSVAITFNPASPNGLLFYYGDHTQNRDFLSIAMIDQRVEYRYNLGSGPSILISNQVSLNEWHNVIITLDGPSGSMIVDGGTEIHNEFEGALSVLNAAGDIFLGGVSDYDTVSPHAGTEVGFTGCISDIEINGVAVDILGANIGGRGIADCSTDACADLTCYNGGSCQVTGSSDPKCLCTLGFSGPTCNIVIAIAVPYFTGQSHIAYDTLSNVYATTSLTLEIRPFSPDGLLLYNQQTNGVDYIALLLRDGRVELWYNLGSGAATISSRTAIELDTWHTIEVYRSGASGQLIVDGTLPVTGSSLGHFTGLQLGDPLYIGGVSELASGNLPPQIRVVSGYEGCIGSVSSDTVSLLLISDAISGVGVEECPCLTSECLNNGACFVETSNGSSGQYCVCSLPFTGETCTTRVEGFLEALFSGQSYLQYSADVVGINLQRISTSVEITFTPTSLTGLLFYMGPDSASIAMDYLYIALNNSLVELRFDLGSGEVSALTTQPLLAGESYTITVERSGRNGMVSVSDGGSATVQGTSTASQFDYSDSTFVAYLGGAPSVATLPVGDYVSGISGCISALSIGQVGNMQHIPLSNAATGSAVDFCS